MLSIDNRARKLSEMVGQPLMLAEMRNRSKGIDFAQSMIMEGNTGSGKTTLALIIASLLNCHEPVKNEEGYFDPCGTCFSCKDIKSEQFHRDVFVFDASNMGKGDVVDLQQKANIQPIRDKHKIFIIDEAQALSKAGLGATLALLEKKRKNVYIILCTMDTTALDKSIKGRCQTYLFRPVKEKDIARYLFDTITRDEIEVPDSFIKEGLFLIGEFADGSIRDALQYLERCIYGKYFTAELMTQELGFISKDKAMELLSLLLKADKGAFKKMAKVDAQKFFTYSYSILVNIFKYKMTGYVDQAWKKNSYEIFSKEPNLRALLDAYDRTLTEIDYFKPRFFDSCLSKYYFDVNLIPMVTQQRPGSNKRTPV